MAVRNVLHNIEDDLAGWVDDAWVRFCEWYWRWR
jgi:hypothetical protein